MYSQGAAQTLKWRRKLKWPRELPGCWTNSQGAAQTPKGLYNLPRGRMNSQVPAQTPRGPCKFPGGRANSQGAARTPRGPPSMIIQYDNNKYSMIIISNNLQYDNNNQLYELFIPVFSSLFPKIIDNQIAFASHRIIFTPARLKFTPWINFSSG